MDELIKMIAEGDFMDSRTVSLEKSMGYFRRANEIIPCQSQTLSKRPQLHAFGEYPVYLKRGKGSHVFDVDGNEYIDYPMSLGPVILGHCYPKVDEAMREQLKDGITYTLMHPLEVEVAELIIESVPCAEMVRYGKTGSDACSAAVKIARAYTGRQKVASYGYHGWHDWYNVVHFMNEGTPECLKDLIYEFQYNNINSLKHIFDENHNQIACVIMEPVSLEFPEKGFLEAVKELAHKNGALLIFDEIVTGFRYSLGGAQEYFNVIPDLACFGKAMANGMPVSAFVGKKEFMSAAERLFISFTHGGEALSLAAAKASIEEIRDKNVVKHITGYGNRLQKGINDMIKRAGLERYMECKGISPHTVIMFNDYSGMNHLELKTLFFQETIRRGVLFGLGQNPCYSHDENDMVVSLDAAEAAIDKIKEAVAERDIRKYINCEIAREIVRRV